MGRGAGHGFLVLAASALRAWEEKLRLTEKTRLEIQSGFDMVRGERRGGKKVTVKIGRESS